MQVFPNLPSLAVSFKLRRLTMIVLFFVINYTENSMPNSSLSKQRLLIKIRTLLCQWVIGFLILE